MVGEDTLEKALEAEELIIYGAHLVAKEVYRCLKKRKPDIKVLEFVVTDITGNPDSVEGIPVAAISEVTWFKSIFVLVAMPEKYHYEVADNLKRLGYYNIGIVGLKEISILKGKDLVWKINQYSKKYYLAESKNDYSWLDIFSKDEFGQTIKNRHYKFTILTKIPEKDILEELEKLDFIGGYERTLGNYESLPLIDGSEEIDMKAEHHYMDLYMIMSHKDEILNKEYCPLYCVRSLEAGAELSDEHSAVFMDNSGDNISEKNVSFAEMTGMYWIWKNAPKAKYKGLCHYRRHFALNDKQIQVLERNNIDVVLTTPRLVLNGIKNMFLSDTPVKKDVFENMIQSIGETVGKEYAEYAETYFESMLYYPNNMLIAKEDIFNAYCTWIFPILFQMEKHDGEKGIVKKDRHIAFSAELLTSLYFSFHKDDYRIAVTDYVLLE